MILPPTSRQTSKIHTAKSSQDFQDFFRLKFSVGISWELNLAKEIWRKLSHSTFRMNQKRKYDEWFSVLQTHYYAWLIVKQQKLICWTCGMGFFFPFLSIFFFLFSQFRIILWWNQRINPKIDLSTLRHCWYDIDKQKLCYLVSLIFF